MNGYKKHMIFIVHLFDYGGRFGVEGLISPNRSYSPYSLFSPYGCRSTAEVQQKYSRNPAEVRGRPNSLIMV